MALKRRHFFACPIFCLAPGKFVIPGSRRCCITEASFSLNIYLYNNAGQARNDEFSGARQKMRQKMGHQFWPAASRSERATNLL